MLPKNKPIITDAEIKQLAMFLGNYLNKEQCAVKTDEAKQLMNKEVENNNAKSENDKPYITSMVTYSTVPMLIIRDTGNKALIEIEYAYLHQDLKGMKKLRLKGVNAHKILRMKNNTESNVEESAYTIRNFTKILYEACDSGIITLDERENLLQEAKDLIEENPEVLTEGLKDFIAKINNNSVFMEKKTEAEYRLEKFKKEHDFIPDKTKGGNDPWNGTIKLDDGKRMRVDLAYWKKTLTTVTQDATTSPAQINKVQRQLSASTQTNTPEVHIDKDWLRMKHKKEREAMFDHEVGHIRLQSYGYIDDPHNPLFDKKSINRRILYDIVRVNLSQSGIDLDGSEDGLFGFIIRKNKNDIESVIDQWKNESDQNKKCNILTKFYQKMRNVVNKDHREYEKIVEENIKLLKKERRSDDEEEKAELDEKIDQNLEKQKAIKTRMLDQYNSDSTKAKEREEFRKKGKEICSSNI